ncbi:hypothetical protein Q7P37_003565 [Cladosporium fusiforme]
MNLPDANKQEIELFEDDPAAVPAMMRFLYNISYTYAKDPATRQRLSSHAHVYAAANRYDLLGLKKAVVEQMSGLESAQESKQQEFFATYSEDHLEINSVSRPFRPPNASDPLR